MPIYRGVTKIQVGSGSSPFFWKDNWNQTIYADAYPRAYSYTISEDISVKELLTSADLHETFHLPLSIQSHDELRYIQDEVAMINALSLDYAPFCRDRRIVLSLVGKFASCSAGFVLCPLVVAHHRRSKAQSRN